MNLELSVIVSFIMGLIAHFLLHAIVGMVSGLFGAFLFQRVKDTAICACICNWWHKHKLTA